MTSFSSAPQADQTQSYNSEPKPAQPHSAQVLQSTQPQPSVSVIMPVYNVEPFLRGAMECVCAQTLEDAEFICVNDGSTDGSLAILQEYAARDGRIRILDGPNGGYGKAMNRGIDAARGKYIGIYEPDDYIPANMFADLVETAEKYDAEVVKADYYTFRTLPDGSMQKKRVSLTSNTRYYNRVLCPGEEFPVFRFRMFTWTGVYRRDFLNQWNIRHSETPGASFQDNGFWFQTFCRAKRLVFSDQAYYHYRQDNPDSSVKSVKKLYCMTEEYRLIENRLKADPNLYEQFKYVFYARKFNAFIYSYRERAIGHRREYLHHIQDELREPYAQGLLHEECMMNRTQWIQLHEIMADPDAYFAHICVSVIVPVHNAAGALTDMLKSLLCSWELQYEVIGIDAGSSDGSLDILREYEADERVRVYALPEAETAAGTDSVSDERAAADAAGTDSASGGCAAECANAGERTRTDIAAIRNLGIRLSKGEYLLFLDPGCRVEPELIRRLHEDAHTKLTDITVCRSDRIPDAAADKTDSRADHDETVCAAAAAVNDKPGTNSSASSAPGALYAALAGGLSGVLLRAEFLRDQNLQFAGSQAADELRFLLSAFDRAAKTSLIEDVLLHHRTSPKTTDRAPASLCANPASTDTDPTALCANPASAHTDPAAVHAGSTALYGGSDVVDAGPAVFYTDPACFWLVLGLQQQASQNAKDLQAQNARLLEIHRADTGELQRLEQAIEKGTSAYRKSEDAIQVLTEENAKQVQANRRQEKRIESLSKENLRLQEEKQKTEAALTRTRQSHAYRIGRAITWLPRKIRALLHRSAGTKK